MVKSAMPWRDEEVNGIVIWGGEVEGMEIESEVERRDRLIKGEVVELGVRDQKGNYE